MADCPAPKRCDDLTKQCVDCVTNADCPATASHCVRGACAQCVTNNDCGGATPICDDLRCRAGCKSNGDCGGITPKCDLQRFRCVQCVVAADCTDKAAPLCNTDKGLCAQCINDKDCPTTAPKCKDGTCRVN
jgi:hypothetical protein